MTLGIASLFTACGDAGTNNKPANASSNASTAASPVNLVAVENDVRKLIADLAAALAKNDADAVDKIYADNYTLVNVDGSVQTKAERLASLRSGEVKYSEFAFSDMTVRVNPEGTSAVSVAKATFKAVNKGKPLEGDFRVTGVWSKTKDGWRQVSAQATKIEAGAAKPDDKAKAANSAGQPKKATGDPKIDAYLAD